MPTFLVLELQMMDVGTATEDLLRELVEDQGVELVHVEYQSKGSPSVLRIYIDKPGGVNHRDCERVSRQVGILLDGQDLIPCHYLLEVSSPGIERPLFKESDYERFVGKEIRLVTTEMMDNRKNFKGFIQNFAEGILDLDFDGKRYQIPFNKIRKANLVHRFD